MGSKRGTPEERFWRHVIVAGPQDCWLWTGASKGAGYGQFTVDGQTVLATHFSWELHNCPLPKDGTCVLHRCDVPACVNPDHLWLGSHADNAADKVAKGRVGRTAHNGEDNGQAVLSETDVIEMFERRRRGQTYTEIGGAFGVAMGTAFDVLSGRTWAWLTGPLGLLTPSSERIPTNGH